MEQEEPTLNEIDSRLALLEAEVRHTDDGLKGFKAVMPAASLKAVLRVISTIDDEAVLKVTSGGITTLMTDPANASMAEVVLDHTAFGKLEVWGSLHQIAVDVTKLTEILKVAEDFDMVMLYSCDANLVIEFGYFRYELEPPKVVRGPRARFPIISGDTAIISVSMLTFVRLVAAVKPVGDCVCIGIDLDGWLFVSAKGEDKSRISMRAAIPRRSFGVRPSVEMVSGYSLDYLQSLIEAVLAGEWSIDLHIGTDLPLIAEFVCCDGGRVKYIIAPRIDSD